MVGTVLRLLTKRTYIALVLVLVGAFPAVALAAGNGGTAADVSELRRAPGQATTSLAGGEPAPERPIVDAAERLRRAILVRMRERRAARRAERRRKLRQIRKRRERYATLPGGVSRSTLESIAECESGGDPTAVSASGSYRGKYQFSYSTWESVGGSGDPAAASEAEQDYRAALLYAREGSSPWPVCG